ncbi:MAG: transporter maintaining lipid asymmetry, periplasmic binding protein MlaC [Francisellaceae bacterium]|nr:transporter maintaining lipid asymmetry, periplasmic binding protein MlaC [Francisellaceae bacterium]
MNKAIKSVFFIVSLFMASLVHANEPKVLLESITTQVIEKLKVHKKEIKSNPTKVYAIVTSIILPHADFDEMSQWVAGRNVWSKATDAQKKRFISEFKILLVHTYSNALSSYDNQVIQFLPQRGSIENKKRVQISSIIRSDSKDPMRVDYKMVNKNGDWKVYDIIIEGVSLIQGYRSQFSEDIKSNGLEPVIEKLHTHNNDISD